MFKFLFYLFIFYSIYRLLSGGFRVNVFHHQPPQQPPQPNSNSGYREEEGTITINPKVNSKSKEPKEKLGEYVDYEEVK
jgi:hypothetical protein